jgi:ubiquinone/menaquinone biosynthesis C-methylase UbiE
MINKSEEVVSKFYNTVGWENNDGITEDARRWEDLRPVAIKYVHKCRLRVLKNIPTKGDKILDMASGPIQYPEYLKYSENFNKRYCVDLSAKALLEAKKKIGNHGVFLKGSFLDIDMDENYFDCSVSLHTIYHIDKDIQENAVRKLLYVTKPGQPVIIIYSNPRTLISLPVRLLRMTKILQIIGRTRNTDSELYFYQHPNEWWQRFNDVSNIEMYPWRSFAANFTKKFVPNNKFGKKLFRILFSLEETFPDFFVKYFQYNMVVLRKK